MLELPEATQAFCCKHIERNLIEEYGKEIKGLFWKAVKARTQPEYEEVMAELRVINER